MDKAHDLLLTYLKKYPDEIEKDSSLSSKLVKKNNITFEHNHFVKHHVVPYCMIKNKYDLLCQQARLVFIALNRIVNLYGKDQRINNYFAHLTKYNKFITLPTQTNPIISIARFDLIENKDEEYFIIEPNTCCPGGSIWTSMYYNILQKTSVYKYVADNLNIVPIPLHRENTIYDYLIKEYESIFEKKKTYKILIADTKTASMETELFELRDIARRNGHISGKGHIQDIIVKNEKIYFNDMEIDILYQFLDVLFTNDMAQIAENYGTIEGYLTAIEKEKMLTINSFRPIFISEDKSILALLKDKKYSDYFSKEERNAINQLVPETYKLANSIVVFEDKNVNLVDLLKLRKNDFVIKAQMESMGRDVVVGRKISQEQWEEKIKSSLGKLYVAQRFIESKKFSLSKQPLNYTLALFFMGGDIKGMFNRLSPHTITNVAQGGAWQDVIIYE